MITRADHQLWLVDTEPDERSIAMYRRIHDKAADLHWALIRNPSRDYWAEMGPMFAEYDAVCDAIPHFRAVRVLARALYPGKTTR